MSLPRNYVLCRLSRSLIFVVSIIYKFLLLLIVLWWYSLSNISKTLVEALSNSYFNYCNAFSLWVVFCWFSLVVWFFFWSKDFRKLLLAIALTFTLMFCVPQSVSLFPTFEVVYDLSHPRGSKERTAPGSSQLFASPLPSCSVFRVPPGLIPMLLLTFTQEKSLIPWICLISTTKRFLEVFLWWDACKKLGARSSNLICCQSWIISFCFLVWLCHLWEGDFSLILAVQDLWDSDSLFRFVWWTVTLWSPGPCPWEDSIPVWVYSVLWAGISMIWGAQLRKCLA